MHITFVLVSLEISGGVLSVFELSNQLVNRGHKVQILHCAIPPWEDFSLSVSGDERFRRLFRFVRSFYRPKNEKWFYPLLANTIRIPRLRACYFPEGDALIATSWWTAEEVFKADKSKGKKFYFIQGYETWGGPVEQVKATYRLPMKRITVSTFLGDTLKNELEVDSEGPVIMGVNFSEFNFSGRSQNTFNRIGMLYHPSPMKGVKEGIKAFEIAREKFPDIKLVMFGAHRPIESFPSYVEYHFNVPRKELIYIYGSCSIWLVPSLSEGCNLICMEAMACGCAVVSTRIGGIDDYAIPGESVLISEPGDVKGLASNLIELLSNRDLLFKIAQKGFQHIQQYTWSKTAEDFLKCLKN